MARTTPDTTSAVIQSEARSGQRKSAMRTGTYAKNLGSEATAREAATALIGSKSSAFAGRNAGQVATLLESIVRRGNGMINYADAADIVNSAALTNQDGLPKNLLEDNWLWTKRTGFDKRVDAGIAKYAGGDQVKTMIDAANTEKQVGNLRSLEAQMSAANQKYQALVIRSRTQRVSQDTLSLARAEADAATIAYNNARARSEESIVQKTNRENAEELNRRAQPARTASVGEIFSDILAGNLFRVK